MAQSGDLYKPDAAALRSGDVPWNVPWLRQGPAGGLELSVAGFVRDMRIAFPGHVRVQRAGFALLPGRRQIARVAIDTASGVYLLRSDAAQLTVERVAPMPGGGQRPQAMELADWLAALNGEAGHRAEAGAASGRGLSLRGVGAGLVAASFALGAAAFVATWFFDDNSADYDFLMGTAVALLISGWQGYRILFGPHAPQTARRYRVVWAASCAILCGASLAYAFGAFLAGMPFDHEEPALLATLAFAYVPVSTLGARFRDLYLGGYTAFFVAVALWLLGTDVFALHHPSVARGLGLVGVFVPLALLFVTSEPARMFELLVLIIGASGGATYWIVSMFPGATDGAALFATLMVATVVMTFLTGGELQRRFLILTGRAFIACLFSFRGLIAAAAGAAAYAIARSWFAASADNAGSATVLAVSLCFVPFWVQIVARKLRALAKE